MISVDLTEAVRKHIPSYIVCDFLKYKDKPVGRSWNDIFAKNATESDFFTGLLTDVLSFGNKTIFAFDVSEIDISGLDNIDSAGLSIIQALKTKSKNYRLFRKITEGDYTAYTFFCTKMSEEIHKLSEEDLNQAAKIKYWTPNSVIRLNSRVEVVVFDSVVFDSKNKILFVLMDDRRHKIEKSSYDMQVDFLLHLSGVCTRLTGIKPMELFPAINAIYEKQSEGIIHRLAFECNTGAVRDERLKIGQLDLRNEAYHTNGKAAIGGFIRPYKLGVTWHPSKHKNIATEVEFNLHGVRQNLHSRDGLFNGFVDSKVSFAELTFVLKRIALYVF